MTELNHPKPTILLIEMDDETRPLLEHNLNHHGYSVIVTLDQDGAIERVRDGRAHVDLILLNQVEFSLEFFISMGERIRQQANLPQLTPIVVVADRFEADMEGKDIKVNENNMYISYPADAQQLLALLDRLCQSRNFHA